VFVVVCVAIFLVAGLWIPGVEYGELVRPFLGAFAMWAIGIGGAILLTSLRPTTEHAAVFRAAPKWGSAGAREQRRSERAERWGNLAEFWLLQVDKTGATIFGMRGSMRIVCCDRTLRPIEPGSSGETGCYVEVSGIPSAYGLERGKLEESGDEHGMSKVFFDAFRPETRATVMRLLRGGARMEEGSIHLEMAKFDEELFDALMEMCDDLADADSVSRRLTEYYRLGGSEQRQRAFLVAVFSLPVSRSSAALAQEKLRDPDLSVRVLAAAHLGEHGSHVLESIVARANSGLAIRLQALVALARQDSYRALEIPGARNMTVQSLKSNDINVVKLAIQALEYIGDRQVLPMLVPLINADHRFRAAGMRAVNAINSR